MRQIFVVWLPVKFVMRIMELLEAYLSYLRWPSLMTLAKADVYVADVCLSHARVVAFSDLKKIGLNETKRFGMVVNEKKNSSPYPCLYIKITLV